jgi:hypothetical protein
MARLRKPLLIKLFIGLLSPDHALLGECTSLLASKYGTIDLESDVVPWEITDYYQDEMGGPLHRKFVFFDKLMEPDELPSVKLFSIEIEERFSRVMERNPKRMINVDPGYVTEAKVVLATTKDFSHRIYIGSGIYAEVTLRFNSREQSFAALEHTYYDYRTPDYIALFNKARVALRAGLKRGY